MQEITGGQSPTFWDAGAALLWLKNVLSVRFRTIGLQTPRTPEAYRNAPDSPGWLQNR